jgi:hypothetical protein
MMRAWHERAIARVCGDSHRRKIPRMLSLVPQTDNSETGDGDDHAQAPDESGNPRTGGQQFAQEMVLRVKQME